MPTIEIERETVPKWVVDETREILVIIDHAGTEYLSKIMALEQKQGISDTLFDTALLFRINQYEFSATLAQDSVYGCSCISHISAPMSIMRRAEWFRRGFRQLVAAHTRMLDDRIESKGWKIDRSETDGYSHTKAGYRVFIPFGIASTNDCRFYLDT
jgi:hypothetical protein